MLLFYLLLALLSVKFIDAQSCPYGCPPNYGEWVPGKCYRKTTSGRNAPDSNANCMADGGYLARIENNAENTAIFQSGMLVTDATCFFIGATDTYTPGIWMDSSGSPQTYLPWMPGQPDDAGGIEHCIALDYGYSGYRWNDLSCGASCKAICQHDCAGPPVATPSSCPFGCQYSYSEWYPGSCYRNYNQTFTLAQAETICAADSDNSTILVINSAAEQTAVVKNASMHGTDQVWMGVDCQTAGVWQKTIDNSSLSYTNWNFAGFYPNSGDNACAFIDSAANNTWDDVSCATTVTKKTICKSECSPGPCSIRGVNPTVHLSSVPRNYKVYPNVADCSAKCAAETNFTCAGFVWMGPNSGCVLHGKIDMPVIMQNGSKWFLIDLHCAASSPCWWPSVASNISPTSIKAQMKAVNVQNHIQCQALCLLGVLLPKCGAYALSTDPFYSGYNCYLFPHLSAAQTSTAASGKFTIFQNQCL